MAEVYRKSGALTGVIRELKQQDINFLESLDEIMSFGHDFDNQINKIKVDTILAIEEEKLILSHKIEDLSSDYNLKITERRKILTKELAELETGLNKLSNQSRNIFSEIIWCFKSTKMKKRIRQLSSDLEHEIRRPLKPFKDEILVTTDQLRNIETNIDSIIEYKVDTASSQLKTAKLVLGQNKNELIGAIGEQKAIDELKQLPPSFYIINDFRYQFKRALYHKQTGKWIKSVQLDHIVVGPPGVFVIETKNWSASSINNIDFYSPVEQIQRANYALFRLLNSSSTQNTSLSLNHHWGTRKIPINNIILMIKHMPKQEFKYVKILPLRNIRRYITDREVIFSNAEIEKITKFILHLL